MTHAARGEGGEQAVTIAVAKRPGVNATDIAHAALERVDEARSRLLPADVLVDVTRNYGETASEKSNELMLHLLIATLSVTILIGLFLGWREALVVLVAVPVTLALTLFVYYALGYSLNRITLFALIFSIGILVDDAIVVVENIYRHLQMGDRAPDVGGGRGRGRGRQPDHPRHLHRHRGDPADGVRLGTDGPLHAAHPGRRLGGDARLARGGVHHHAVPGAPAAQGARRPRAAHARPRARAGGSSRASRGSTPAS